MVWEGYRACGYGRGVKGIGVWERHRRYGGALGTGEYGECVGCMEGYGRVGGYGRVWSIYVYTI